MISFHCWMAPHCLFDTCKHLCLEFVASHNTIPNCSPRYSSFSSDLCTCFQPGPTSLAGVGCVLHICSLCLGPFLSIIAHQMHIHLSRDSPGDFWCLPYVVLSINIYYVPTLCPDTATRMSPDPFQCPVSRLSIWYQATGSAFAISSWFLWNIYHEQGVPLQEPLPSWKGRKAPSLLSSFLFVFRTPPVCWGMMLIEVCHQHTLCLY